MVLIDGKKFACAACVKGHRSSSCTHTDRTLLEIGKKGRPPTQCSHCRERRRTSKVHSKCMCADKPPKKAPHVTVLPNGVTILTKSPSSAEGIDTHDIMKQKLNPCFCSLGEKCRCPAPAHSDVGIRASNSRGSQNDDARFGRLESAPKAVEPAVDLSPTTTSSLTSRSHKVLIADSVKSLSDPLYEVSCQDTLFAPQTAGTVMCFCGINCPCPGCLLHDPLGLKFPHNQVVAPCPTSTRVGEGCIGGLDLPTVNELLNLSPITERFSSYPGIGQNASGSNSSPNGHLQLPSVSETFGLSTNGWKFSRGCRMGVPQQGLANTINRIGGCCGSNNDSSSHLPQRSARSDQNEITKLLGNRSGEFCGDTQRNLKDVIGAEENVSSCQSTQN